MMPRSFLVKKVEEGNKHWSNLPSVNMQCAALDLSPRCESVPESQIQEGSPRKYHSNTNAANAVPKEKDTERTPDKLWRNFTPELTYTRLKNGIYSNCLYFVNLLQHVPRRSYLLQGIRQVNCPIEQILVPGPNSN